jgi:hypothetical protein
VIGLGCQTGLLVLAILADLNGLGCQTGLGCLIFLALLADLNGRPVLS